MDFSPGSLLVSTIFGIVGVYYFKLGKGDGNAVKMLAGVGLMIYSFLVKGMWANLLVGLAIALSPWALARFGIDF